MNQTKTVPVSETDIPERIEKVLRKAADKGESPAENLTVLFNMRCAFMRSAVADWPDAKDVVRRVFEATLDVLPALTVYTMLDEVIDLYGLKILSMEHEDLCDERRLALLCSEIAERLCSIPEFRDKVIREDFAARADAADQLALRGAVLRRIVTDDVLAFAGRFFQAEMLWFDKASQQIRELVRARQEAGI